MEFIGRVGSDSFNVRLLRLRANSFHPKLHGRLEAVAGATECHLSLGIPLPVRIFVAVISVFLTGLGLVCLFAGFDVPGFAALVFLGLAWVIVSIGLSLTRNDDERLLEKVVTLLDGRLLQG